MKLSLADLWSWHGKISRAIFLLWAALLFALKYNIDRLLLKLLFDHEWSLFNYINKPIPWLGLSPADTPWEYFVLLAVALPFLWVGMMICIKRLRAAGLPIWLAVLFVIPAVKWLLFLALAIVPDRELPQPPGNGTDKLLRILPKSRLGSATLAVGITIVLAVGATFFGTQLLREYGWGLFVAVPFCLGFLAVLIYGGGGHRTLGENILVALLSVTLAGTALLVVAIEGVICILMAAPLALLLATAGALVGHIILATRSHDALPQLYCVPLLAIPMALGIDHYVGDNPPLLRVSTSVQVNASPTTVWRHVVSFTQLSPPDELIFKCGIAYPIRAEIEGQGPGSVRNCIFSTGPFVEPIEVWEEPCLLRFSVTKNPAPMQEWTPYRDLHPAHLDGFLISRKGEFRLIPLPGGNTRLEGTTWYHHSMWPAAYWQLWSDYIIHKIHSRVLAHVKALAEGEKN
jgi:uncharacterized membrane protein YhaH (DUF805 family)